MYVVRAYREFKIQLSKVQREVTSANTFSSSSHSNLLVLFSFLSLRRWYGVRTLHLVFFQPDRRCYRCCCGSYCFFFRTPPTSPMPSWTPRTTTIARNWCDGLCMRFQYDQKNLLFPFSFLLFLLSFLFSCSLLFNSLLFSSFLLFFSSSNSIGRYLRKFWSVY